MKNIDIVMATYNGEKYIEEQLKSLVFSELYEKLVRKIIISDDNSTDSTCTIIRNMDIHNIDMYINSYKSGPVGNFFHALSKSTSDYVMFCDQDDVWESNKIKVFFSEANKLDPNKPGVVYSNLTLVNGNLEPMGINFFENESIPSRWGKSLEHVLLQNISPGCAMLINKACVERMLSTYNNNIIMHDWWALLFASLYDNVIVLDRPTVFYRQHSNNAIGASKKITFTNMGSLIKTSIINLSNTLCQAETFIRVLTNKECEIIKHSRYIELLTMSRTSFKARFLIAISGRKIKSSFARDIFTRFFLFLIKKQ